MKKSQPEGAPPAEGGAEGSMDEIAGVFDMLGDKAAALERFNEIFVSFVPHNRALAMRVINIAHGNVEIILPYAAHLVGDPETGVLHGGPITSLMDASCGASVFLRILRPVPVATLDLRIDYMRPAEPGRDVIAYAECYHMTRNVAFARGFSYHDDKTRPIASAAATFMLQSPGKSVLPDSMLPPPGHDRGAGR